ncbi:PKD domain-containing protein [Actinomyces israelii]|uniref:PKD domain-containing protein n=1 Tax=Actinomyces israelii TaxID=1659 RepID=UPI0025557B86|nr:PKD domain-containing protein [Actinomyces israelii]WKR23073.1 hypothetical protein AIF0345_3043 [Actinomyces israelii]
MNETERSRPLVPLLILLAVTLVFSVLLPMSAPARAAAGSGSLNVTLNVVILGDSYSSGSGAGDYEAENPSDPDGPAYRSRNSWAHHYVGWLNEQGAHATLTTLARSGATAEDVANGQIGAMPADTDLVMLAVGGADVGVPAIAKRCFVPGSRSASGCRETVEAAGRRLESATVDKGVAVPSVRSQTRSILEALDAKLADGAQVVLVSYPYPVMDRSYRLSGAGGEVYDAGAGVRSLSEKMRESQSALVDEWNAVRSSTLKVTCIDSTAAAFSGHEPDPSAGVRNDRRWINGAWETEGDLGEDGTTVSRLSGDASTFYQLNKIGHEQIAELIEERVGVPGNARPAAPSSAGTDIVFVVSAAASVSDDVAALRASMRSIADRAGASSSSCRFALVSYGGGAGDERARTDVDFTADAAAVENGLDSLARGGGAGEVGRASAPVYSGIMRAMGLSWRSGARREVIVIGDAPAGDPEPGTGYTAASVARAARAARGGAQVTIYGISAGGSASLESLESLGALASASGGSAAEAGSPDDLPGLVDSDITAETSRPFAWVQGGAVVKAGDALIVDASASYATSGRIVSYEWDFDGDGAYDQTTATPRVEHVFPDERGGVVGVRVTQSDGRSATAASPLMVTDDGDQTPRESDNCPDTGNWGQTDYDSDGVGDECDPTPGFPAEDAPGVSEITGSAPAAAPGDESAGSAPAEPAGAPVVLPSGAAPASSRVEVGSSSIARTGTDAPAVVLASVVLTTAGAVALRVRTDLGAEVNRSRCGGEPISAGASQPASATPSHSPEPCARATTRVSVSGSVDGGTP